jgi:RNA polymerase sigma-70 factor, ECF subfamily
MLGSVPDAEDALQEALLRVWRGLPGFEGRSSLRSWLYRIATNACLKAVERRPKRVLPVDFGPAADPHDDPAAPLVESVWVEPYPDERLAGRLRRPGGPLRAAREHRARVHRSAPAPAAAPARRPDPA